MTRDEIVEMMGWKPDGENCLVTRIQRIAETAVAAERERCAKVCESLYVREENTTEAIGAIELCVKLIRGRRIK